MNSKERFEHTLMVSTMDTDNTIAAENSATLHVMPMAGAAAENRKKMVNP
jgi:hypothetical protein